MNYQIKSLDQIILQKIQSQKKISFQEFMELCLYNPGLGYYSRVSPFQDYYTNVDVPYFAQILSKIFYKLWQEEFKNKTDFKIIELGSGEGKLAKKILETIKRDAYASQQRSDGISALAWIRAERGMLWRSAY